MPTAIFGYPLAANKLLIVAAALGVTIVFIMLVILAMVSRARKNRLLERLNVVGARVDSFQERANVVSQYADHYFNSLIEAADPRKLHAALGNLDKAMGHVDLLIATRNYREADSILRFLEGDSGSWQAEWSEVGGLQLESLKDWETNLEAMIQITGQNVAAASQSMKDLGVKKSNRARKPTMLGLRDAGVIGVGGDDESGGEPE